MRATPNDLIRLDITTNQPAVQVFTTNFIDIPRKRVHGGPALNYSAWSAVALEQEGYIDAINTPEFGVNQIRTQIIFLTYPVSKLIQ